MRELEHLIERAVLLSDGPRLRIPAFESGGGTVDADGQEWTTLEEAERRYVAKVLRHTKGRVTGAGGAAELLDLKPSTLNWRIDKLGLSALLAEVRGARRRAASG